METIFSINPKRKFTLNQAEELLPLIYRITEESSAEVKSLSNRLSSLKKAGSQSTGALEEQIDTVIEKWNRKIEKLGAAPKGLWLADFDKGDGYYCWKFPETKISFYHGYEEGFSSRKVISNGNSVQPGQSL